MHFFSVTSTTLEHLAYPSEYLLKLEMIALIQAPKRIDYISRNIGTPAREGLVEL